MGGVDKGWAEYQGQPLIHHVLHAIKPQVGQIIISANRELDRYKQLGHPVYPDSTDDFPGPLSGLSTCLPHLRTPLFQLLPCDTPQLPSDLTQRLGKALGKHQAAIPVDEHGQQPLCGLYRKEAETPLRAYLLGGQSRVMAWAASLNCVLAEGFTDPAFVNVNGLADLE